MTIQCAIVSTPQSRQEQVHSAAWSAKTGVLLLLSMTAVISCGKKGSDLPVDYSSSNQVRIVFGKATRDSGLRQAKVDHDGITAPDRIGGLQCHLAKAGAWNAGYIYFIVDPTFKRTPCRHVSVNVHYFDSVPGYFELQYDGMNPLAPGNGAYTACPKRVVLNGAQEWKVEEFVLRDVRFQNSQNGNADLRLHFKAPDFRVYNVTVARLP